MNAGLFWLGWMDRSLGGCAVSAPVQPPLPFIGLTKLRQSGAQFVEIVESSHPQQLSFECAEKALDAPVSFMSYLQSGGDTTGKTS